MVCRYFRLGHVFNTLFVFLSLCSGFGALSGVWSLFDSFYCICYPFGTFCDCFCRVLAFCKSSNLVLKIHAFPIRFLAFPPNSARIKGLVKQTLRAFGHSWLANCSNVCGAPESSVLGVRQGPFGTRRSKKETRRFPSGRIIGPLAGFAARRNLKHQ